MASEVLKLVVLFTQDTQIFRLLKVRICFIPPYIERNQRDSDMVSLETKVWTR